MHNDIFSWTTFDFSLGHSYDGQGSLWCSQDWSGFVRVGLFSALLLTLEVQSIKHFPEKAYGIYQSTYFALLRVQLLSHYFWFLGHSPLSNSQFGKCLERNCTQNATLSVLYFSFLQGLASSSLSYTDCFSISLSSWEFCAFYPVILVVLDLKRKMSNISYCNIDEAEMFNLS